VLSEDPGKELNYPLSNHLDRSRLTGIGISVISARHPEKAVLPVRLKSWRPASGTIIEDQTSPEKFRRQMVLDGEELKTKRGQEDA